MRIRKTLALLATVVLGISLMPAGAAAAPAAFLVTDDLQPPPNVPGPQNLGTYYLVNASTRQCLDAPADRGWQDNTPVDLWTCNNGTVLRWNIWYDAGRGAYPYTLINAHFGNCLDYPANSGGAIGWRYNVYKCSPSAGQRFRISGFNAQTGGRLIAVELSGPNNHMDAFANGGSGNGRHVGNWAWTGHPLQHWYFRAA